MRGVKPSPPTSSTSTGRNRRSIVELDARQLGISRASARGETRPAPARAARGGRDDPRRRSVGARVPGRAAEAARLRAELLELVDLQIARRPRDRRHCPLPARCRQPRPAGSPPRQAVSATAWARARRCPRSGPRSRRTAPTCSASSSVLKEPRRRRLSSPPPGADRAVDRFAGARATVRRGARAPGRDRDVDQLFARFVQASGTTGSDARRAQRGDRVQPPAAAIVEQR